MPLPIETHFLKKGIIINEEELMKLLIENGCHNYRNVHNQPSTNHEHYPVHNSSSLRKRIENLSSEHNLQVPEDPLFYSFFKLDDIDFLDTYLYLPEFSHMLHFPHSNLESVTKVSKGLTEMFQIPLLGIYEGRRWKIPKLQLYENGELSRVSEGFVGENEYDEDWVNNYWERITQRADESAERHVQNFLDAMEGKNS